MIKRDIQPQWRNIASWYWTQYQEDRPNFNIWQILERDHGLVRTWSMNHARWSVVNFPDEQSYTHFLLRWARNPKSGILSWPIHKLTI